MKNLSIVAVLLLGSLYLASALPTQCNSTRNCGTGFTHACPDNSPLTILPMDCLHINRTAVILSKLYLLGAGNTADPSLLQIKNLDMAPGRGGYSVWTRVFNSACAPNGPVPTINSSGDSTWNNGCNYNDTANWTDILNRDLTVHDIYEAVAFLEQVAVNLVFANTSHMNMTKYYICNQSSNLYYGLSLGNSSSWNYTYNTNPFPVYYPPNNTFTTTTNKVNPGNVVNKTTITTDPNTMTITNITLVTKLNGNYTNYTTQTFANYNLDSPSARNYWVGDFRKILYSGDTLWPGVSDAYGGTLGSCFPVDFDWFDCAAANPTTYDTDCAGL